MLQLDAPVLALRLDRRALIAALDRAFREPCTVPARQQYALPAGQSAHGSPGGHGAGTLLVMPAGTQGRSLGIKIVTVFPENSRRNLHSVNASYLLLDAASGQPRALLDGTELTLRRTAAASALASMYLSRTDASRLVVVGTGNLAPHLIESHALVRPIRSVRIWGRRAERATALAARLSREGLLVEATDDLQAAVRWADLVSCATLAHDPLVLGAWLRPGQHLDLVGSFTAQMREADDEAIGRCDLYVDTRAGALAESGEIIGAIARGVIDASAIRAELSDLPSGRFARAGDDAITVFKSVGTAIEDLAAAELACAAP